MNDKTNDCTFVEWTELSLSLSFSPPLSPSLSAPRMAIWQLYALKPADKQTENMNEYNKERLEARRLCKAVISLGKMFYHIQQRRSLYFIDLKKKSQRH